MKNQYKTKINQEIQGYLEEKENTSFYASELLSYMEEHGIQVNQATIYRNLDKLVDGRKLVKFKTATSKGAMYRVIAVNNDCHNHLHMQCRICGKILHLEDSIAEKFVRGLKESYGFDLDYDDSVLGGVCRECRDNL